MNASSGRGFVIEAGGEILVLNRKNEAETQAIYDRLTAEISD